MTEPPTPSELDAQLDRASALLRHARAMLFTAGAGMGVDSGLPDFRGPEGFWRAYPPYRALGLEFAALANPRWFREDPALAWGFYGHRLQLYRDTVPHTGFAILRDLAARSEHGAFVFTSNIDGHFVRAGFDPARVVECHGTLDALQCVRACGAAPFDSATIRVEVDLQTFRARPPLPACSRCGGLARPAVLMFGDAEWDGSRTEAQERRLDAWLRRLPRAHGQSAESPLVVVECGAGLAVPTVRHFGEHVARAFGGALVRINVRESDAPGPRDVSLPLGAKDALTEIAARLCR